MIRELELYNYRNFSSIVLNVDTKNIALIGKNGAGKTNILEAISLLHPGKGFRSARLDEICKIETSDFYINSVINSSLGASRINTSYQKTSNKKITEFNGVKIKSKELSSLLKIVWLTPQMNYIFNSSSTNRRKFLDRIIYNIYPEYMALILEYDHCIKERLDKLQEEYINHHLISILEEKIAKSSIQIVQKRFEVVKILQEYINRIDLFLSRITLELHNSFSNFDESQFIAGFLNARFMDKKSKRTNFGPHRTDFIAIDKVKNLDVKYSSGGEQKIFLISIVLAQLIYLSETQSIPIVVLLDETFSCLDSSTKLYLNQILNQLQCQVWITSTEKEDIREFDNYNYVELDL